MSNCTKGRKNNLIQHEKHAEATWNQRTICLKQRKTEINSIDMKGGSTFQMNTDF
jgi:hypothetical protein